MTGRRHSLNGTDIVRENEARIRKPVSLHCSHFRRDLKSGIKVKTELAKVGVAISYDPSCGVCGTALKMLSEVIISFKSKTLLAKLNFQETIQPSANVGNIDYFLVFWICSMASRRWGTNLFLC